MTGPVYLRISIICALQIVRNAIYVPSCRLEQFTLNYTKQMRPLYNSYASKLGGLSIDLLTDQEYDRLTANLHIDRSKEIVLKYTLLFN